MGFPHCFAFCCNNVYTHRTHTYMIMLCSIFANHNRMLVVHLVVASKVNAAMKTRSWPPFVRMYVTFRKVRWIILSLEIHRLCVITRLIISFFSHNHACLYSNKRTREYIVRNNHCHSMINNSS